ncbi:hypothetical protein [Arthrobacter sp. fls2-241-R2A-200]|uniref:hypothetical protein n=1 Tax=Arthrobacter sp. fls2-241-R2A-200 TaxID=3040281 RepID=UPI00254F405C|nr:hypothetical protein [Arthrobacter sp. fls2-241-R2A-200]
MPAMIFLWGVALILATAATTLILHRKLTHGPGPEPDAIFWDLFAGSVVVLPGVIVPALLWPPAALIMLVTVMATAAGTLAATRKVERIHAAEPRRRAGFVADAARHAEVLRHWQQYELDPAQTIDFPAMTDVRAAETAAFTQAMREAERCKVTAGTDYGGAVEHLAQALIRAERAAGVPAPALPAPGLT